MSTIGKHCRKKMRLDYNIPKRQLLVKIDDNLDFWSILSHMIGSNIFKNPDSGSNLSKCQFLIKKKMTKKLILNQNFKKIPFSVKKFNMVNFVSKLSKMFILG